MSGDVYCYHYTTSTKPGKWAFICKLYQFFLFLRLLLFLFLEIFRQCGMFFISILLGSTKIFLNNKMKNLGHYIVRNISKNEIEKSQCLRGIDIASVSKICLLIWELFWRSDMICICYCLCYVIFYYVFIVSHVAPKR